MDQLCANQEQVLSRLERAGIQGDIGPKLNEEHDIEYWNAYAKEHGDIAPQLEKENEKETPQTVSYDELVKSWADTNGQMPEDKTEAAPEKAG